MWHHRATARELHRLAGLKAASLRAGRDTERVGGTDIEAAGTRVLDEGEPERLDAVRDREGDELVLATLERCARAELDQLDADR